MSAGASRKLNSSNVLGDQEGTAADPARAYLLLVHPSPSPSAPIYWQAEPHAAKTVASAYSERICTCALETDTKCCHQPAVCLGRAVKHRISHTPSNLAA